MNIYDHIKKKNLQILDSHIIINEIIANII
jgi:hypothetical protein